MLRAGFNPFMPNLTACPGSFPHCYLRGRSLGPLVKARAFGMTGEPREFRLRVILSLDIFVYKALIC
jgi:hypothetical protein